MFSLPVKNESKYVQTVIFILFQVMSFETNSSCGFLSQHTYYRKSGIQLEERLKVQSWKWCANKCAAHQSGQGTARQIDTNTTFYQFQTSHKTKQPAGVKASSLSSVPKWSCSGDVCASLIVSRFLFTDAKRFLVFWFFYFLKGWYTLYVQ